MNEKVLTKNSFVGTTVPSLSVLFCHLCIFCWKDLTHRNLSFSCTILNNLRITHSPLYDSRHEYIKVNKKCRSVILFTILY